MQRFISYLKRNGTAISILFNTLTGGASNQTFSARNWEWKRLGKYNIVWAIDSLFFLESEHCFDKWVYWRCRKDVIHELEIAMKDIEYESTFYPSYTYRR